MSHYNTYSSQFIAWELPGKVHLEQEHDCLGTLYPNCPIPPQEVSLPNIPSGVGSQFQCHLHHIPLPTKHSLSDNNIGSPLPLTTRVIITPHQLLGYKYEKRKRVMVVERFTKKLRVDRVSVLGQDSNKERRGKIIWKESQFHWVSV